MDWENYLYKENENEKPLDSFPQGISNTAIFRTMAFIGDSLSSGEFESRDKNGNNGYHDMFEYSWGQYIARKNGLTAYNFSCGGMTAQVYMESFAEKNRMFDPAKAAQAYVIALGVNDLFGRGQEVGLIDDIDPEDYRNNKPTFVGFYASIIARYKEIQPRAKFFFVTLPDDPGNKDELRIKHREALYKLAEFYDNSYVLDIYKYGPKYDDRFKERFFLYGHMNAEGYIFTANMIDSYIDYIIRHNPDDFRRVPFIGTELK